ncbi:hypothetical protein [Chryseobacterium turcicum]|uniref:Uncharacterized protein n=1 Tax=Chryseobacterium turcicum TaxID=2898076 RepID=A0A9Q3V114_9FLAO|nr:hypothetical protein [Chryseobacterium turcicum]MCD1115861.1 hypothetical protein [Chryseobacterium turcicum]
MIERIKIGQKIYKDFDYIRPFFSLFFWDYLLKIIPDHSDFLILISRIFVIIESFIICHIIQRLIFKNSHIQVTIFLLICFLHSFPIMPWHTIDGIFFSVLSLFFYNKKWYLSALIFVIFAALTKQSFFIFGFVMSLIIIKDLYHNRLLNKSDLKTFIFTTLFLIFSLFHYDILNNFDFFFNQVFNSSASSNFYESSIAVYFLEQKKLTFAFIFSLILIYFIKINRKTVEYFLVILFPIIIIFPFLNEGIFLGIHSLFLILIVLFLKYEPKDKFIFLILFLAWSSSISWGYNTPIFFILIFLYKFIEKRKIFFLFLWGLVLATFFIHRIKYTYLSDSLLNQKHIFTQNIRSVSGLLISENEYFYILEAQQISKEYKEIIFLPGSPILDIINTRFHNRASWEMDVEYPSWKTDLKKLKTNIIAVDNQQSYYKEGFYKSSFTLEQIKQKKIIKKTKYFTIYGN